MPDFFSKDAKDVEKEAEDEERELDEKALQGLNLDDPETFANILALKEGAELTVREREKIYCTVDMVQKNYLELRKDQRADIDLLVEQFIEKKDQFAGLGSQK